MKKLLGSTLALAMFLPAAANAELLKNLKVGGDLDVNAVTATNLADFNTSSYDQHSNVQTRLMVKADWDLLDDVHSHLSIDKNDRTWGGTAAGNGGSSQNVNQVTTLLWVDEANVKIDKLFGALDTTIGRQFYGEAGDLVIYYGPRNDYGLTITALDALRMDWNAEKVGLTLLAGKVVGTGLGAVDTNTQNLWGIDVHVKPMDNASGAVYGYAKNTTNSNTTAGVVGDDHLYVVGVKAKVMAGPAWIKVDAAKNFGENRTLTGLLPYAFTGNYTGWAAKVNLGAKADLANAGAVTGWAEGGIGSGGQTPNRNFQAIAGDYRPGGIAGRFWSGAASGFDLGAASGLSQTIDNGTLSNRVDLGAGVKFTPAALNKLTAALSYWNYHVQNATALQNQVPGNIQGNKALGSEYDLDLTWQHSENVSVSAGAGIFNPGSAYVVTQGPAVNTARVGYAEAHLKF